jgi:hypothetical protein
MFSHFSLYLVLFLLAALCSLQNHLLFRLYSSLSLFPSSAFSLSSPQHSLTLYTHPPTLSTPRTTPTSSPLNWPRRRQRCSTRARCICARAKTNCDCRSTTTRSGSCRIRYCIVTQPQTHRQNYCANHLPANTDDWCFDSLFHELNVACLFRVNFFDRRYVDHAVLYVLRMQVSPHLALAPMFCVTVICPTLLISLSCTLRRAVWPLCTMNARGKNARSQRPRTLSSWKR